VEGGGGDECCVSGLILNYFTLFGVSNLFFSIAFGKSAFFGDHVCACKVRTRGN
jgi:hypothetical protein